MKIGFVFHKNPLSPAASIDVIRLYALTEGLARRGVQVDILAPVEKAAQTAGGISVYPLERLRNNADYDILKTCYHFSMELIRAFQGPVVSRIVRVVDEKLPERDAKCRKRLLRCQEMICARSSAVVLNNEENKQRWRNIYGQAPPVEIIPTGCPSLLPRPGGNPYDDNEKAVLFLGSLSSFRMVRMINILARRLPDTARIHYIGRNKHDLYGTGDAWKLSNSIIQHGELTENQTWNYIRHARLGLAIAPGPHLFDNDLSKIYNYLRGGLPVLSEEGIVNNDLVRETGCGDIFRYDDAGDAVAKAALLLDAPQQGREKVMSFMAGKHAWEKRVDQYFTLFHRLQAGRQ